MTINLMPRNCLSYRTLAEACLAELGKELEIRFA